MLVCLGEAQFKISAYYYTVRFEFALFNSLSSGFIICRGRTFRVFFKILRSVNERISISGSYTIVPISSVENWCPFIFRVLYTELKFSLILCLLVDLLNPGDVSDACGISANTRSAT
jgi:hypothetical protein